VLPYPRRDGTSRVLVQACPVAGVGVSFEVVDAILLVAIAAVLVVPMARRVHRRRFDPFEPIVLFAAAYGVMFVVRPAAMLAKDAVSYTGPRTTLDVSATFTEMLAIALLGAVSFVAAYELVLRRADRHTATVAGPDLDFGRATLLAIGLAALGIGSFAVFLASADGIATLEATFRSGREAGLDPTIEANRYLWQAFFVLVPAAVILLAVGSAEHRPAVVAAALVVIAIFLLREIPLGARISLLPLVGGLFVLYYLRLSSRPSLRTLLVLVLLAVFASAFLSDLRARTTRGETVMETFSRAASPSRLADSVLLGPDSEMAPTFAAALTVIPESLGHSYGETIFGDLVVRPIPRPLWEGKPEPPRERLVATLWRSEREAAAINPEFSVLLYPYWDFGLIGVAIGLALAGAGCRAFYRYLGDRETETSAQVLYALAIWFVVIGLRNSPVDTLILAVFIVAPAWVVFRFARRDRGGIPNQRLPREGRAAA
jgi:hypothetical protein